MRLILVRHTKAEDREKWSAKEDLRRPLTKKGIKQAKNIGKYLKKYQIDAIIASLAIRASDTAKYVAAHQKQSTFFLSPSLNPEAGIEGYIKCKEEIQQDWEVVSFVGHEPTISEFVRYLCGEFSLKIGKGCVVELEQKDNKWRLVGLRNF
ncbi:phosphohistidine phosphatase SixA [Helicobacter mesocricetorum]|uniref:phosphohistidine phosphatase SixA n=1 Tax=Helicobacter mesocricetorum TaxID=87012 RepID=UPI000CF05448|nr:phosphohistidine phosphatase SixA [Helicobacter mesocricetorum]